MERTIRLYSSEQAKYIWRDGVLIEWDKALIHVNAVGHASVAGIFEGIKAYWNEEEKQLYIFRMKDHYRRFLCSIKIVRFNFPYSLQELIDATIDLLRANEYRQDVYIRPYVFQKGVVRELLQAEPGRPTELVIDSWPFISALDLSPGLHCCVSSWWRISDNVLPPRIKCFSNYHNGRLAAMEAKINGYDWPILLDATGKVTEGPGACLAIVRDGKIITPPVTSGILEGITRDTVLRLARETLNIPCEERVIDRTELYVADEIFFMGTAWEIMPVLSVDRLPVGQGVVGPVTKQIREIYGKIVRGYIRPYLDWLTPVW
ncbi:MAG: branched-chain amino acid transaminase [Candidatus Methanomethyliaceae archaeon]